MNSADKIEHATRVLGVGEDVTLADLKRRYRTLAIQKHPDQLRKDSSAVMAEINRAYELLKKHIEHQEAAKLVREQCARDRETKVVFRCDLCHQNVRVPIRAIGGSCKCPHCTNKIDVPVSRIVDCGECGRKNSIPMSHNKRAVCGHCYSIISRNNRTN